MTGFCLFPAGTAARRVHSPVPSSARRCSKARSSCVAQIGSIDHSINKAFTSVACRSETGELGKHAQPGGQFHGIADSINGRAIVFAGGIPLEADGQGVGGVGVSGGSGEQDQSIAEAIAAVFQINHS
ncbi:MAG: heme-binding protein [Janthinobacterium lividum]